MAEEATADVFITLWKKRSIIDPNLPIQSFLFKIAKDTAYNYLKKIASNARLKQAYLESYPTIDLKKRRGIISGERTTNTSRKGDRDLTSKTIRGF